MAGAASSDPRAFSFIGVAFMTCGVGAAVTPAAFGNLWLGLGFGVLHIVFGYVIARKHGG